MSWDTACPDWTERILSGRSLVPDLPLFEAEAEKGLRIFKRLRLPDVAGNPRFGEVGGDWLFDIVRAMFGSFDVEKNKRMIQEFFLLIPKKNGKSTAAAAILLVAAIVNRRPNAEFIFVAPSIEVASISFRQARGIVLCDPALSKLFHIQDNLKKITHRKTDAYLKILTMDADVITGSKATGMLIDEVHVFSTKAHAADLFLEVRGGLASRPDGFLFCISTQSKAPPAGIFKAELDRARAVRNGLLRLPKPLLPILYELPPNMEDRWQDETLWPLINPNLNRSVDPEALRSWLIDAKRKGPGELALYASQHFDVEIGQSLRENRWPGTEFWEKQTDPSLSLERILELSEIVVAGVDGGGLDDLFALCILARKKGDPQTWMAWFHAWCHEGVLERRQTIASTLRDFQARGELTIVTDQLDDISEITAIIADIKGRGILGQVAVDPAGIGQLIDALGVPEIGITPENKSIIGAPQGYQMMSALKTAERKLANGTLWHHDSHLAKWCVSNVKVEPTATAIRPTKINAGDAKIDVAMAMFNAVTVMSMNPARAPEYQMIFA